MTNPLVPGDPAPDFSAMAVGGAYGAGESVRLSDFRGRPVVLYFYPKDDTPGCTAQACAVRDHYKTLLAMGAEIFGVSVDAPESHASFIAKYQLPFSLLSDEKREIVQAYGVWVEKHVEGKTVMGTERTTYVIRPDGFIKSIFRRVNPEADVKTVLQDLRHFEP